MARQPERHWADYMRGDDAGPAAQPMFPFLRRRGPVALIGLTTAVPAPFFRATGRLGAEQLARFAELARHLGGEGVFRWDNGEERHATVVEATPSERLVLDWDDEGTVELTLQEVEEGTRLLVRESTPEFSTALALRAMALSYV